MNPETSSQLIKEYILKYVSKYISSSFNFLCIDSIDIELLNLMNGFILNFNFSSNSDKNRKGLLLAVYIIFFKNIFVKSNSFKSLLTDSNSSFNIWISFEKLMIISFILLSVKKPKDK